MSNLFSIVKYIVFITTTTGFVVYISIVSSANNVSYIHEYNITNDNNYNKAIQLPTQTIYVYHGEDDRDIINALPELDIIMITDPHPPSNLPIIHFYNAKDGLKALGEVDINTEKYSDISDIIQIPDLPDTLALFGDDWYGIKLASTAKKMNIPITAQQLSELESVAVARAINPRYLLTLAAEKDAPNQFSNHQDWLKWLYLESMRIKAGMGPFSLNDLELILFKDEEIVTFNPRDIHLSSLSLLTSLSAGNTIEETEESINRFLLRYHNYFKDPTVSEAKAVSTTPFLYKPYNATLNDRGYYDHTYPSVDNNGVPNNAGMLDYLGRTTTKYDTHDADDFWIDYGSDVLAPANGTVVSTDATGVFLDLGNNYKNYIGHMSEITVFAGQSVTKGQRIGASGTGGGVNHIHFEIRHNGKQVDTMGWYGGGSDPCLNASEPQGNYRGCESSVWLWADESPPGTCCGCLPASCCASSLAASDSCAPTFTQGSDFVNSSTRPAKNNADFAFPFTTTPPPTQEATPIAPPTPTATPVPDTQPPTSPEHLTSDSHAVATWSRNNQVHLRWSPAVDFEGPVRGYALVWGQNPLLEPAAEAGLPADATEATSPALSPGAWYAHLRAVDKTGNASETVHLGPFYIDAEPPVFSRLSEPQIIWSNRGEVPSFSWPAANDEGELAGYKVYWGADANGKGNIFVTNTGFTPSDVLETNQPSVRYLRVAAEDAAGNQSDWQTVAIWHYDPVAPTGSLTIANGSPVVRTLNVTLNLEASDKNGFVTKMRFSSDGVDWTEWEPYARSKLWQLSNKSDLQTIYAQLQDEAGNTSEIMAASVTAQLNVELPSSPSYTISRSTFSMGGEDKSSNNYHIRGTIGQAYQTGRMQSSSYQVNSGYWAGSSCSLAEFDTAPDISTDGSSITLSWTAVTGANSYNIYRDTAPFFTPTTVYANTSATTWTDPDANAIGDADTNYYYIVKPVNSCGEATTIYRLGEFDFGLMPGE